MEREGYNMRGQMRGARVGWVGGGRGEEGMFVPSHSTVGCAIRGEKEMQKRGVLFWMC